MQPTPQVDPSGMDAPTPGVTAAPAGPRPININPITLRLDHDNGVYPVGALARVQLSLDLPPDMLPEDWSAVVIITRGFLVELGRHPWDLKAGQPLNIPVTLNEPGQIMVTAEIHDGSGAEEIHRRSIGLIFGPEGVVYPAAEPADFDDFWTQMKADWRRRLGRPMSKEVATSHADVIAWNTRIPVRDSAPVSGYFARPRAARQGSCPAVLFVKSAGGFVSADLKQAADFAHRGFIVFDTNPHGLPNGKPQAYYEACIAGQDMPTFRHAGIDNPRAWAFKDMFLRVVSALDYLAEQPEWNGRELAICGSSMGGAQAIAGAGLDSRVTTLSLNVPAMCGLQGDANWPEAWPKALTSPQSAGFDPQRVIKAIAYFDMPFFARRARAAAFVHVGLIDPACPAMGITATLNNLALPTRVLYHPQLAHGWVPTGLKELHQFLLERAGLADDNPDGKMS